MCTSDDYEFAYKYSVPFGGFFSCNQGNPLASISLSNERNKTLEMAAASSTCPQGKISAFVFCESYYVLKCTKIIIGYSQHPAAIDYDCLINYCVKANSFGSGQKEIPIELPPFQNYDEMFAEEALTIEISVVNQSIVIIILATLLGFAILAVETCIAMKKSRRNKFNGDVNNERGPLNNNKERAGYQSLTENDVNA